MPEPLGKWDDDLTTGAARRKFNIPPVNLRDASGHEIENDIRGLMVIHAVLLYTGRVLLFCGHVESSYYAPKSYVFNPDNPSAPLVPKDFPSGMDLFCCHYVQIPDGRILVVGGSDPDFVHHRSVGAKNICIFEPNDTVEGGEWKAVKSGFFDAELKQGRWYPTAVLTGDGRVLVFSGRPEHNGGSISQTIEVLCPPCYNDPKTIAGGDKQLPIYPGLHLMPNGKIYFTGTTWGQEIVSPNTFSFELASGSTTGIWQDLGWTPLQPNREEGMSVLLPPAQDGKILLVGGSLALDGINVASVLHQNPTPPSPPTPRFTHLKDINDPFKAEILDTNKTPIERWTDVAPYQLGSQSLKKGRINCTCVILPDSTVLVVGGHNNYKWNNIANHTTPSLECEIFNGTKFTEAASIKHPRMYHSIALLLPDGRVLVAGGADPNDSEPTLIYPTGWVGPTYGAGQTFNRKDFEIYKPPYFFNGPRPIILDVCRNGVQSRQIPYGGTFVIKTPQALTITKIALMRPGAVTHHTDSEQRYVQIPDSDVTKASGELTVKAPTNKNLAPPGYYMLWIMIDNLPCEKACFVQLIDMPIAGATPPATPKCSPCFIATATLGSAQHKQVIYLQNLRTEIESSGKFGNTFIQIINNLYYTFSPTLARHIEQDVKAKEWIRFFVISPIIKLINFADWIAMSLSLKLGRIGVLILLLSLEALLGIGFGFLLFAILILTFILKKSN